jgi:hypothetical protein
MFFDSDANVDAATPYIYYRVYQERFNDGGFSDVYMGERRGSPVAIKCIRVNIGEQSEKTLAVKSVGLIVFLGSEQNSNKKS